MNPREHSKLELTAYHEAGHTVACYTLRYSRIRHVSIIPDDNSLGRVVLSNLNDKLQPGVAVNSRVRDRAERAIMFCLAGDATENLLRGEEELNVNQEDYRAAMPLAQRICGDHPEPVAYLLWLYYRVRNLLLSHWDAVQALADALMERKKIGREEVVRIVKYASIEIDIC